MKKTLLFIALTFFHVLIAAQSVVIDGIYYNLNTEAKTAEVANSGYDNPTYSGDMVIPSSFEYEGVTYTVTSIANEAFWKCTGLTSVVIPDDVTTIGEYAFRSCSSLTSVSMPINLAKIGESAFRECTNLQSITIPANVIDIGDCAFIECFALKAVYISDLLAWFNIDFDHEASNPLELAHHLYLNGDEITDLVIPNEVTTIGDYTFSGCNNLSSISIPSSVTSIGVGAFKDCSKNLLSVIVDSNNTNYDSRDNCNAILATSRDSLILGCRNTVIPTKTQSIGYAAFYGCDGLTSIVIPEGNKTIEHFAFYGCTDLTSVTIPSSVTAIRVWSFVGCSSLEQINISDLAAWCEISFVDIKGMDYVPEKAFDTMPLYYDGEPITDLVIPDGVTQIPDAAFMNMESLCSLTLPNSLFEVSVGNFQECPNLSFINFGNSLRKVEISTFMDLPKLKTVILKSETIPNIEMSFTDGRTSILYVPEGSRTDYISQNIAGPRWNSMFSAIRGYFVSPEGIYYGMDDATQTATVITTDLMEATDPIDLNIPSTIDYGENTYTVTTIGERSFMHCSSLTTLALPATIDSIGERAFYYCDALTQIYCYADEVPDADPAAFEGSNVSNATLFVPEALVNTYKATSPYNSFKEIKPLTTTNISEMSASQDSEFFDTYGCKIESLQKGINIIKVGNETKKVIVK